MNIFFTCIGRRVELIQQFRRASTDLGIQLKIIGGDIVTNAPALMFCDKIRLIPLVKGGNYITSLLKICEEEKIDCLIPTIDTDLLLLAENKNLFEQLGTRVLISKPEKVALCRDKRYTAEYFSSLGLSTPMPVDSIEMYNNSFPAFIKPKDGSSSINAYKVDSLEELKTYAAKIKNYIIQPYISGKEYTVDIFCDYTGNPVFITPRERLSVRAGEVLKTKIEQDKTIIEEMEKLVSDFKPSGAITIQLIKDEKTKKNYYIEINPRFGGGAPLSMKAGADSAKELLRMLCGEKIYYQKFAARNHEVYSRFDQSVCIEVGTANA